MKQASLNLDLLSKKTRKQIFLEEMERLFRGLTWKH